MNMRDALAGAGYLACILLAVGCSADVGSGAEESADAGIKVPQPNTETYEYAPAGVEFEAAKVEPYDGLSPKGSVNLKYGSTYRKEISVPANGVVGCYTAGGSVDVDPVLVLFRRHDNQFKTTPYTEHAWLQTLAINDDSTGRHAYLSFTNTGGTPLNTYLMAFAYGNATGTVDLHCTGYAMETIQVTAGSLRTTASSGTASTSGSNGDPWLFMFDETPLSYWSDWNDDTTSTNRESTFSYSGGNRPVWFVTSGFNTGTTTVNY